jgi:hypothetical protein
VAFLSGTAFAIICCKRRGRGRLHFRRGTSRGEWQPILRNSNNSGRHVYVPMDEDALFTIGGSSSGSSPRNPYQETTTRMIDSNQIQIHSNTSGSLPANYGSTARQSELTSSVAFANTLRQNAAAQQISDSMSMESISLHALSQ